MSVALTIPRLTQIADFRIRRSKFTEAEDQQLMALVAKFGQANWGMIAPHMPGRTVRQCRDRWNHYLTPDTKVTDWTPDEEKLLIKQICLIGRQWSKLTALFPGRTGIAIRNHCCKLARQKNSDPSLRAVLFEDLKRIKFDMTDARELTEAGEGGEAVLPSCLAVLMAASIAGDATQLYPVMPKSSKTPVP
jgi:hypothetical protein